MAVQTSEKGQPSEVPPPAYNEAAQPSQEIPIVTNAPPQIPQDVLPSPQPTQQHQPIYQDGSQPRGIDMPQYQQPQYAQQPQYQQSQYVQQPQYGQQVPMQAVPQQGQYAQPQVVPLTALQGYPAPVLCPRCHKVGPTKINRVVGNTTHGIAAVACFVVCLGCIPYLIDSLRDVEHKCSSCGSWLATWHRSGRTIVHAL